MVWATMQNNMAPWPAKKLVAADDRVPHAAPFDGRQSRGSRFGRQRPRVANGEPGPSRQ
jgi:hypothetical protein